MHIFTRTIHILPAALVSLFCVSALFAIIAGWEWSTVGERNYWSESRRNDRDRKEREIVRFLEENSPPWEREREREKRYFSYIILHIQKYIHRIFIRGDIYRKLVSVQKEMSDGARQKRERDKKGKEKIWENRREEGRTSWESHYHLAHLLIHPLRLNDSSYVSCDF